MMVLTAAAVVLVAFAFLPRAESPAAPAPSQIAKPAPVVTPAARAKAKKAALKKKRQRAAAVAKQASKRQAALSAFQKDWNVTFSPGYETSWYVPATSIELDSDGKLHYFTDIYPDEEGRLAARSICNFINFNYVLSPGAGSPHIKDVVVYGQGKHPLGWVSVWDGDCG